jgi:hypothetical protein
MLIKDLDGNSHNWLLGGNMAHSKMMNKSSLHIQARTVIKNLFPTLVALEEVPIILRKSETLFLDFYLPLLKFCVEVHGEQHYKFVGHYHSNKFGFIKQKKRDREKIEWCHLNDIIYIELPFNETAEQWSQRITNEYERTG